MLGPYRLLHRLSGNTLTAVYTAVHTERPSARVAVKVLQVAPQRDEATLRSFISEARVGSVLRHPNVLHVDDAGMHEDHAYLVMELLEGGTLARLCPQGMPLPVGAVVALGLQICAGLSYLHEVVAVAGNRFNLVHRDIKPANLFVTADGAVKIIDFGVAHLSDERMEKTRPSVFHGTVSYASPEQAKSEHLDGRSDLFSLGLVLQQLLTGQRVFDQPHEAGILNALFFEPLPDLAHLRPDLPEPLCRAVQWVLRKDRCHRPSSAAGFASALEEAVPVELRWTQAQLAQWVQDRQRALEAEATVRARAGC